jgi:hypothetical protein
MTQNFGFSGSKAIDLTGYVPYVGATQNVNLGAFGLTADFLQLSTTPATTGAVAQMWWNDTEGTMNLGMKGGNAVNQIGTETYYPLVVNKSGVDLTQGTLVMANPSGIAQGNRISVIKAISDGTYTAEMLLGILTEDIAKNQQGFCTWFGYVHDLPLNTLQPVGETWAEGNILYSNPAIAGGLSNTLPTAPALKSTIAVITSINGNNLTLMVRPRFGSKLGGLNDVNAPTPSNNDVLYYVSASQTWRSNSIAGVLGYTPTPQTRTLTINGTTYDLSANRTWTIASGMVNPMTTAGDLIYGGVSGTPTRLALGTSGYVLQAGASAPTWFNLFGTDNTWTGVQTFNPTPTASGGVARTINLTSTLIASANNDALVSLDINPSYTLGAFTGVKQMYIRTPTTNASTSKGGVYIGGNSSAGGTDFANSPDLWVGYGSSGYTYINFLASSNALYGQITYGSVGSYKGFLFTINGTSATTGIYNQKFQFVQGQRTASIGQEADTTHSYQAPTFNNFYLRMSSNNDNTRYFKIFTDNASATQTERFALQGFSNSAIAYFNNVAGVGFNVVSPTALVHVGGSTTATASLRIVSGTAPTSPNDGDMWYDGTNVKFRVVGTTKTFTLV